MDNKKIKILAISHDNDGVGYYRINSPYLTLNDPDIEVKLLTINDFSFRFTEENLKNFNIIIFQKGIPFRDKVELENFSNIIKNYNIKLILDIDDYWILDSSHVNYRQWKNTNSLENTLAQIRSVHFVSTTTPIFAEEIKKINPNVVIFENAINHKEQQWTPNKVESDKVRFLWGGGITHKPDLMLLKDSFKLFNKEFIDKTQLYMCGFDMRVRSNKGEVFIDDPKRNMWGTFESIFTNNGRNIQNSEYKKWLNDIDENDRINYGYSEKFKNEFYQRRWTKPIFTYGTMYNESDVALAPLRELSFNKYKSQLKVLEAGIHKLPIIASNFGPYKLDVIDGKHGFLIDENNKREWYEKMKWFIDNPNAIKEMGESLNELILEKYTLEKINKKRIEFFKFIVNL